MQPNNQVRKGNKTCEHVRSTIACFVAFIAIILQEFFRVKILSKRAGKLDECLYSRKQIEGTHANGEQEKIKQTASWVAIDKAKKQGGGKQQANRYIEIT